MKLAHRLASVLALGTALMFIQMSAVPAHANSHSNVRSFLTTLTGAEVVGPAGDPDGVGIAALTVNPSTGRICYVLAVRQIDGTVNAAHIHEAVAGMNGPVVVTLRAPAGGISADCDRISRSLARDIVEDPENFYVDVHSTAFPDGAVRGQLD